MQLQHLHYIVYKTWKEARIQFKINCFLLLDDSVVLKVITIYNKDTDTVEEVLLEELQIFKVVHISYKNLFKLNLYKLVVAVVFA